jgi:pimeloyl-ACP methyl ester carboxylesterase
VSVAVIDAPSDRQAEPWLGRFRQTKEHAADVKAVVEWLRAETMLPVWLVGTSRGTQSAAWLALASIGADGLVLTSTILVDPRGRPVSAMPIEAIAVPTLVVHHRDDGCSATPYAQASALAARLTSSPRKAFLAFDGGTDEGDPCEAAGHHGYAGIEARVVDAIVAFVASPRKMKKPPESVTAVISTDEPTAGSRPVRSIVIGISTPISAASSRLSVIAMIITTPSMTSL